MIAVISNDGVIIAKPHAMFSTLQDKPCNICGNIGVLDAIFTCSKCKILREHVYCMKSYPKEIFEDTWICEECEMSKEIVSPKSGVKKDLPESTMLSSPVSVHHEKTKVCFKWEKTVQTGKVKYIPAQEAIMLSSGAKKFESPTKVNLQKSPSSMKTMKAMHVRTPVKDKTVRLNSSSYIVRPNPSFGPAHLKSPKHGTVKINSTVQQVTPMSKELQGKQSVLTPTKENIHQEQPEIALNSTEEIETLAKQSVLTPTKKKTRMEQPMVALNPAQEIETIGEKLEKEQPRGALNLTEEIGTTDEMVEKEQPRGALNLSEENGTTVEKAEKEQFMVGLNPNEEIGNTDEMVEKEQPMGALNLTEEIGTTDEIVEKEQPRGALNLSEEKGTPGEKAEKEQQPTGALNLAKEIGTIGEMVEKEHPMDALNLSEEIGITGKMVEREMNRPSCAFTLSTCCQNITSAAKQSVLTPIKENTCKEHPIVALHAAEEIETSGENVEKAMVETSCTFSPSTCCPNINSSGDDNTCTDLEPRNSAAENGNVMNILPTTDKLCPTDPALHASWKGSFKIFDTIRQGELIDGFKAHPPSRVHRKVYEFSKKMPEILKFEVLPRSKFWKEMFEDDIPDKDDIGLYFFSRNGERSENYINLLEYIQMQNLVMRSYMDGVELLLSSSKLLNKDSQIWKEHYFLWGVFRRVKKSETMCKENEESSSLARSLNCTNCEEDMEVDMEIDMIGGIDVEEVDREIDMIGGEHVGRIDVYISKESPKQGLSSPREESSNETDLLVSRQLNFPIEKQLVEVKREFGEDIPPGFEKSGKWKKTEVEAKQALLAEKESKSFGRVSEAVGAVNSQTTKAC